MKPQNPNISSVEPLLLRQVGEALYGSNWQTPLCAAIGVSDRSVRRWVAGQDEMPRGVWHDIHRAARETADKISFFDNAIVELFGFDISEPLEPVPNSALLPDGHGLVFAMQTSKGRPVRCYIRREVLDDRIPYGPFSNVAKYFSDHSEAFYAIAQRKFDEGDYDGGLIEISNADVEGLDLPDVRLS